MKMLLFENRKEGCIFFPNISYRDREEELGSLRFAVVHLCIVLGWFCCAMFMWVECPLAQKIEWHPYCVASLLKCFYSFNLKFVPKIQHITFFLKKITFYYGDIQWKHVSIMQCTFKKKQRKHLSVMNMYNKSMFPLCNEHVLKK